MGGFNWSVFGNWLLKIGLCLLGSWSLMFPLSWLESLSSDLSSSSSDSVSSCSFCLLFFLVVDCCLGWVRFLPDNYLDFFWVVSEPSSISSSESESYSLLWMILEARWTSSPSSSRSLCLISSSYFSTLSRFWAAAMIPLWVTYWPSSWLKIIRMVCSRSSNFLGSMHLISEYCILFSFTRGNRMSAVRFLHFRLRRFAT